MFFFLPKEFEFLLENKNGSKNILRLWVPLWVEKNALSWLCNGKPVRSLGNNTFASAWKMLLSRLHFFGVAKLVSIHAATDLPSVTKPLSKSV